MLDAEVNVDAVRCSSAKHRNPFCAHRICKFNFTSGNLFSSLRKAQESPRKKEEENRFEFGRCAQTLQRFKMYIFPRSGRFIPPPARHRDM